MKIHHPPRFHRLLRLSLLALMPLLASCTATSRRESVAVSLPVTSATLTPLPATAYWEEQQAEQDWAELEALLKHYATAGKLPIHPDEAADYAHQLATRLSRYAATDVPQREIDRTVFLVRRRMIEDGDLRSSPFYLTGRSSRLYKNKNHGFDSHGHVAVVPESASVSSVSTTAYYLGDPTGAVYVDGYYRSDGTFVQPHWRSSPDGTDLNNYSTKGIINPFTGKRGTKRPR